MYSMKQQALKQNKLNLLLKSPKNLFHTKDLFLLWGVNNKNTLYTIIKRYVQKGVLIRIQKGFYSKVPLVQANKTGLGISFLHSFAYVSTETILSEHGIISQDIPCLTLISGKSKRFEVNNICYISRQLKDKFLFNKTGIVEKNGISQASPERAVADLLYFSPNYHFDALNLIDWQKVKSIQKEIGYI